MASCKFNIVNQIGETVAEGSFHHENGRSLDPVAINAAAQIAITYGLEPEVTVKIWRESSKGVAGDAKRPEKRKIVKEGESPYKAVAV